MMTPKKLLRLFQMQITQSIQVSLQKIVVVNKDNPYWFDTFLDKIHAENPLHVSVVDDNKHMDFMDDDEVGDIEDTLTILTNYIEGLDIQGKKKPLTDLMTSLYNSPLDEHNYL